MEYTIKDFCDKFRACFANGLATKEELEAAREAEWAAAWAAAGEAAGHQGKQQGHQGKLQGTVNRNGCAKTKPNFEVQ